MKVEAKTLGKGKIKGLGELVGNDKFSIRRYRESIEDADGLRYEKVKTVKIKLR